MKKLILIPILVFSILITGCSSVRQGMNPITVNDKKMRAYVKGSGKQTVVLLSGWGTENPIDDFMTLIDELSSDYRVVALEYFGYGESDITEDERSNKAIVKEIRIYEIFIICPAGIAFAHQIIFRCVEMLNYCNEETSKQVFQLMLEENF